MTVNWSLETLISVESLVVASLWGNQFKSGWVLEYAPSTLYCLTLDGFPWLALAWLASAKLTLATLGIATNWQPLEGAEYFNHSCDLMWLQVSCGVILTNVETQSQTVSTGLAAFHAEPNRYPLHKYLMWIWYNTFCRNVCVVQHIAYDTKKCERVGLQRKSVTG